MNFPCPQLWSLDPDVSHLNHGSFGAVPRIVQAFQRELTDKVEANPDAFYARDVVDQMLNARCVAAEYLGADEVAFVTNATAGVNTALVSAALTETDEVLISDHAYGGIMSATKRACEVSGAFLKVVHVPLSDPGFQSLLDAVGPRTSLVVIDHITSPTAIAVPIAKLVAEFTERGVRTIVDAAHTPGMLDVNLSELQPTWWTGNFHKWVCSPRGVAVLYAAPEVREQTRPLSISMLSGTEYPASFDWTGTADYSAWLSLPISIETMAALGWEALRAYNDRTVATGAEMVSLALGTTLHHHGASPLAMRLVDLPDHVQVTTKPEAQALMARIAAELRCEVAINVFDGAGRLRLSANAYNDVDEYDRFATGLAKLLGS